MDYVHRCIVCGWERAASSPTVTSPRCHNCGCALESAHASDVMTLGGYGDGVQLPERVVFALRRFGAVAGTLLLAVASAKTGYSAGGVAMAVTAVGVAGLIVVMAMSAERA
jgi:hypothetical protein